MIQQIGLAMVSIGIFLGGILIGRYSERDLRCPHCECSCPTDCAKCEGAR